MTTPAAPMCLVCEHLADGELATCAAYPGGIPEAIWLEGADHRQEQPGDQGIRFAPSPTHAPKTVEVILRSYDTAEV